MRSKSTFRARTPAAREVHPPRAHAPVPAARVVDFPATRPAAAPVAAPALDSPVRCVSITTERELESLEPLWRDLFAHSSAPSPFHTWEFVVEWWRHFVLARVGSATGEYEVVVAFDGQSRAIGILPFFVERNLGVAALGTTLQPFGRSNHMETMTDEPVALYRSGREAAALAAIRSHLVRRSAQTDWDIAVLRANPTVDASAPATATFSGTGGHLQMTRVCPGPLVVALSSSWDGYRARLSKSMRDNIAYYPRRLSREVGPWTVKVARAPAEVARATEILIALHRARSRATTGVEHCNHIAGDTEAGFLRAWFARAAQRGQLSIFTLEVGAEIVAAQAFLAGPACLSVYYSGYLEKYYRYSPLTIINEAAIRMAIERGAGRLEFPPGATQWKARWNARGQKQICETSLYSTRPRALARGLVRRVCFRLQNW